MLNQKIILEHSIVKPVFLNHITSLGNFTVLQITFQTIKIKRLDFKINDFQKDQNCNFYFSLHILRLISVMTGKLLQHISVSYFFRKKISQGNVKLKLFRSHIFFIFYVNKWQVDKHYLFAMCKN